MQLNSDWIKWFNEITMHDVATVGGKNASLGEMYQQLYPKGIEIPYGFAIAATAYRHFLASNRLDEELRAALHSLDARDIVELKKRGKLVRNLMLNSAFPADLQKAVLQAYQSLKKQTGNGVVAIRSSATAEDLPDASFAGAQETYLNIQGEQAVIESCQQCFASLFTDRAISYRQEKGFDHLDVALSIGVQLMVRAGSGSAGTMFSIDTETGFQNAVLINASYGYGESIVKGSINPDEYYVFKPTLKKGFRPILQKVLGSKTHKLIDDPKLPNKQKIVPVKQSDAERYAITDDDILQLARWACVIEEHYTAINGRFTPMDIEWAKDGPTGQLAIVQARPETVHAHAKQDFLEHYQLKQRGPILATGRSVGQKIVHGLVQIVTSVRELANFQPGAVLVTEKTDPDWEPYMKLAAAIVTNRGGRTCHAAIVARELGVPAIVGTETGTNTLQPGQEITLSCAEGEIGFVYEGKLPFIINRTQLTNLKRPKTKIMMNIANPSEAFRLSFLPDEGAGLVREEFIFSNSIAIHPLALIHYDKITNSKIKSTINKLTKTYRTKSKYFVDKLAQGIAVIAAAFYPKDVIVRLSDFKSNEYANLIGGKEFEPVEENPMLGFRGASRYYDDRYKAAFALECEALRTVRTDMGLENVKLMVPFCRTVKEAKRVIQLLDAHGLKQGENNLELYVMCEVPSNVILADEFADLFDGFSIGSNDLTQLVLGVDRDSEIIAHLFDERDEAVKRMITLVIQAARNKNKKIGICGQAPSDYPDFVEFLIKQGIKSMSLNPDAIVKTTALVCEVESHGKKK